MSNQKYVEMLTLSEQDVYLANEGGFTLRAIKEARKEKLANLGERICKLLVLDPASRAMFLASNRGTPTFDSIHRQLEKSIQEQKTLLYHDKDAKTKSGAVSGLASVQYSWRAHQKVWSHLTSDVMASLLPERIHVNDEILALWNDRSSWAREQLLFVLRFAPLKYGAWRAIKQIFKEAEVRMDWEVYSILDSRFHSLPYYPRIPSPEYIYITEEDQKLKEAEMETIRVQEEKISALQKKIETLENQEESDERDRSIGLLEEQIQVIRDANEKAYEHRNLEPDIVSWSNLINKATRWSEVTLDEFGDVSTSRSYMNESWDPSLKTLAYLKRRARRTFRNLAKDFPESFPGIASEMLLSNVSTTVQWYIRSRSDLFVRDQLSLLKVVEQSANKRNVTWAYNLLKKEFRMPMKEVSSQWLYRVSQSKYDFTRPLALDYLQNETGVGKGSFHEKGYHKTVIGFLGIEGEEHNSSAVDFACDYLTMVGADPKNTWLVDAFSLENISFLISSDDARLRKLGMHLLEGSDGVSVYENAFSLAFFSRLLSNTHACDFAMKQIRARYTGLNPSWYVEQLNNSNRKTRRFAQDLLKDSTMVAADADWSEFCIQLLTIIDAENGVYAAAWNRLNLVDIKGNKLIEEREKISMEFLRFLFVHPSGEVRGYTTSLIENKICTVDDLGVDFLKTIATKREYKHCLETSKPWGELLGTYISPLLIEYMQDCRLSNIYSDQMGERVRTWLENEFTLHDIGLDWCFERIQWWSSQYHFVRAIFKRDVTLPQLSLLLPPLSKPEFESDNSVVNGARQVAWFVYNRCLDAASKRANFFKKLLMERNERYRIHKGLAEVSADMIWPHETFDFGWFSRWGKSKREPIRAYALEMARYEMSHWVSSGNVGFIHLRTFFSGYYDVQNALVRAIYKPPQPVNLSRINLEQSSFVASELYPYCFVDNEREVDFALRLIADFPNLFGRPEDLLALSDAKDARVRQVVIQVLWYLYKAPVTTPGWRPFAYSVVPYDPSRAIDPIREAGIDPNTLSPSAAKFGKNKHFLGLGNKKAPSKEAKKLDLESRFDLHEFLRRILFTLPRSPEQQNAEAVARQEQMARQFGAAPSKNTKTLQASWRNKKQLVSAIRDLAVYEPSSRQNMSKEERHAFDEDQKDFALFMVPILEEFKSVRSKMLHNTCLTALIQIKNKHQL